ncbi:MAG: S8 family serine peptidase [Hyphomicrobiaceae bacterium]
MRILILAAAIAIWPGTIAAQSSAPNDQRLKQLLEEKFGQQRSTRGARSIDQNRKPDRPVEFFQVKPDGSVKSAPPPQGQDRRSTLDDGSVLGLAPATVGEGDAGVRRVPGDATRLAQSANPTIGVARDTFVIQLKPDITGAQLDALISKYSLNVVRHVPSLGLLHVQRPSTQTRGAAPSAGTITDVLEPPIIRAIRNEPGVEAAFVDTTIAPKTVPRRVDTSVTGAGGAKVSWHWRTGETDDGNWGLKMLRMPPVWRIVERARQAHPERKPTRMTFLDVGFGTHGHLVYSAVKEGMPPNPRQASCQFSHGTHVAGIAGALYGRGRGIDGMVPNAIVEAIPISADNWIEGSALGVTDTFNQRALLYSGALEDLAEFLEEDAPLGENERRVVNISLAYNWSAAGFEWGKDPERDQSLKTHVLNSASVVRYLANRWRDKVLFVTAAGNDSHGLAQPLSAELATPFAFAGTYRSATFRPATNILVVEAIDRDGRRASFSNTGGHISAPGVDVMSTLAGVSDEYGLCSGTSQAAPHVTALAAILFELSPKSTPQQIADAIRTTSVASNGSGAAPRIDALAAVVKLDPATMKLLADLDGDGQVDEEDLLIVKKHMAIIEAARRSGIIEVDLNGDGEVDEDERCWPLVDFNGSGRASLDLTDLVPLAGQPRGDVEALQLAWSDATKDFKTAYAELTFDEVVERWKVPVVAVAAEQAAAGRPPTTPGTDGQPVPRDATPLVSSTVPAPLTGAAPRRKPACQ